MGVQVTLVSGELVWMVLAVLLDYRGPQGGRVSQEMPILPGQVLLALLAPLGFWGQRDIMADLGVQGFQVWFSCIQVNIAIKASM